MPRRIEIFTEKGEEISFSGHCVLGTAHYVCTLIKLLTATDQVQIFQCCEPSIEAENDKPLTTVLMTKAGPVPVLYNSRRKLVACSVPHSFHLHTKRLSFEKVLNVQPQIQIVPTIEKSKTKTFPVVSIVKGMTFSLVDLSDSPEALAALSSGNAPEVELDNEWNSGYIGAMYYKQKSALRQAGEPTIHAIEARVIAKGTEDPGTGSACSALACYLALHEDEQADTKQESVKPPTDEVADNLSKVKIEEGREKTHRHVYAIQQGLDMGRACMIAVEVEVSIGPDNRKDLKAVTLSGRASFFVRGELMRA